MSPSPRKEGSTPIGGRFLPFLPKDNKTWQADEVIRSINDDLAQLLGLPGDEFWSTVRNDNSLHVCIDTYLRYKRRVYDDFREEVEGTSATSQQLARRVFMVLLRMVTPRERDPGGPPREQQAQLLYDMWLLDVPKMMDVAVLYGTQNSELTRKFLSQVFALQPRYSDDLAAASPLLVGNLAEVVGRCGTAADRALKVGTAAAASHVKELRDAVDYLRDATMTLAAFVACYSPAAATLLQPDHGALLCTLASAHDRLLPQLARVFSQPPGVATAAAKQQPARSKADSGNADGDGDAPGDALAKLGQVAVGLRRLGYLLMLYGICGAVPPGERREPKPTPQVAEARGNELMSLLMAVSSAAGGAAGGGGGGGGYLCQVTKEHHLDAAIASAVLEGTIALDDAQFDYLLALVGGDPRVMERVRSQRRQAEASGASTSAGASSAAGTSGAGPSGSAAAGAGPSGSGAGPSNPAAAARMASLVSQVKDLLPDYGDGFLMACLEALDSNPEKVINALLEDNLPPHLAKLDRKLATWGPAAQAGPEPSGSGSGSGSAAPPNALAAMSSWNSLAGLASTSAPGPGPAASIDAAASKGAGGSGTAGPWRTGAGGGGGALHRGTLKVLDRVDKQVKSLTSRLGDELQWEYEDEYDDSFDDLAAGGADGVADAEGDDGEERGPAAWRAGSARGAVTAGPGPSRLGRGNAAEYDDEPNDASYSRRGPVAAASSASRAFGARGDAGSGPAGTSAGTSRGGGRPPASAGTTAAAAAAAAAAIAAGSKADSGAAFSAPRRAPTVVGQAAGPPAGGRAQGGGRGAGQGPGPGPGGRGGRGGRGGERLWVLDGKIYNYAKEGAQLVNSRQEADAVLDAAKQAALAIHGLGPGGNKGLARQQQQQRAADGSDSSEDEGPAAPGTGARGGGGHGGGGGGGRGGGDGGGGDRRQFDRKEKNKAAVANHHRKDRALRKQGMM